MKYDEIVIEFKNNAFGKLTMVNINKPKHDIWFIGAEIQELLGFTNITQTIKDAKLHPDEKYVLKKIYSSNDFWNYLLINKCIGKYSSSHTLISESGLIKIIASSNKIIDKEKMYDELGIKIPKYVILKTKKEINFGLILKEFCHELKIKLIHQYSVNRYRVDFYLPDLNLGIEFDENYHNNDIQRVFDSDRENKIIENSKINIIRISENYYSIGKLFSIITKLYIKNLTNEKI